MIQAVARLIRQLRESPHPEKPVFAGLNFNVAVRDEELPDVIALNRALFPYMGTLFRLAARGHWIREHRPVRSRPEGRVVTDVIPPVISRGFRLAFAVSGEGEVSILICMDEKDLMYPLAPYPGIREFLAMLERLEPGKTWHGIHFYAYTVHETPEKPVRFSFRRHDDGVTLGLSLEEWQCLKGLFATAVATPKLQQLFAELSLVYGEL